MSRGIFDFGFSQNWKLHLSLSSSVESARLILLDDSSEIFIRCASASRLRKDHVELKMKERRENVAVSRLVLPALYPPRARHTLTVVQRNRSGNAEMNEE